MRGSSRSVRRRVVIALVVLLLISALPVGSPTRGQAQEELRTQTKRLAEGPLEVEDTPSLKGLSSLAMDSESSSEDLLNVQVSKNQKPADCFRVGASETTIAGDGDELVAGYNDAQGFSGAPFLSGSCLIRQAGLSGYAFSADKGQTWTVGGAPPVGHTIGFGPGTKGCSKTGGYVTRGDPWLETDDDTFVYTNLAQWDDNPERSTSACFAEGTVPPAGISVHFGSFHNKSFSWHRSVLLQSPNYPRDFLDKEAVAVDGKSRGAIYITATNFIETCDVPFNGFGQIELYRSFNGGATWDRRIVHPDESFITDPKNLQCGADGIVSQGSAPAIGPGGELYVTWERGWFAPAIGGSRLARATIAFRMSTNRGVTFGALRTIKSICSQAPFPPAGYNRTSMADFPRIAVAREGKYKGRIFVAFQDCSASRGTAPFGRNTDVYVAFSDNFGATWTIRSVHPTNNGKAQFFPAVTTDEGKVRVVYYEDREVVPDPLNPNAIVCTIRTGGPLDNPRLRKSKVVSLVDVTEAVSRDGGQTFVTRHVTTQTTNWCKATPLNSVIPNFGDYIDARGDNSLWADGRNGDGIDRIPTVFYGGRVEE